MNHAEKTKAQLLEELETLRARVAALEQGEAERSRTEGRLRILERAVQQSVDGIAVADVSGVIQFVNPAWARTHGYEAGELLGRHLSIFHTEEQMREDVIPFNERVMEAGAHEGEIGHVRKDGTTFPTWMTTTLLKDEEGNVAGFVGTARDITGLKRTERALLESEARFRQLFDEAPLGYHELDAEGRITRVNRTELDMLGYAAEEVLGKFAWEFVVATEASREATKGKLKGATPPGRAFERTLRCKDGTALPVLMEDRLLRDGQGCIIGVRSTVQDIAEHKRAEEALKQREATLASILRAAPIGIGVVCDRVLKRVNDRLCEIVGCCPEDLLDKDARVLYPTQEEYELVGTEKYRQIAERDTGTVETRWVRKDGAVRDILLSSTPLDPADPSAGVTFTALDISERKRAEEALRQSEERFRSLVRNSSDIISILAPDGTTKYQSPSIERILGYGPEALNDKNVFDYIHPDDVARVGAAFDNTLRDPSAMAPVEYRFRHADGSWVHVESVGSNFLQVPAIGGVVVNSRDITERKRAEEDRRQLEVRVRHAQKLESLGVLAGGLAHDFNNLLVGILGNASLALMDLPEDAPARYSLEQIEKAALRTSELTGQMLAYSGRGKFVVQPTSLSTLVEEMGHLLESAISKRIVLNYDFACDLPAIEVDPTQIRQVVMNLITNASEAIGEESGVITVATSAVHVDRSYPAPTFLSENLSNGPYVCLEVSDTGSGMDAETQARIFDPFFTTKFAGRGLGLAALLGIVRGHGGAVNVRSKVGEGTTFTILFPASEVSLEDREEARAPEVPSLGHGLVLVVDDEDNVRSVARACLERGGFSVLTAASGQEGVDVFAERADEIALVLLDMTMPDMDGQEALGELRRIREDVTVVLSSGFSEQEVRDRIPGRKPAGFIQKPYPASALLGIVRELLG